MSNNQWQKSKYLRVLCINIIELYVIWCEPLEYHILEREMCPYNKFTRQYYNNYI